MYITYSSTVNEKKIKVELFTFYLHAIYLHGHTIEKFAIFFSFESKGCCALETSRTVDDCSHFLMLVSIRSALLTNIKFDEGWSIVKIRLQKVRLNFHRRNGPKGMFREGGVWC